MPGILKSIFHPRDGSRKQVEKDVASSRVDVEKAVNRFETTISELLDRNDRLTGRIDALQRPTTK